MNHRVLSLALLPPQRVRRPRAAANRANLRDPVERARVVREMSDTTPSANQGSQLERLGMRERATLKAGIAVWRDGTPNNASPRRALREPGATQ